MEFEGCDGEKWELNFRTLANELKHGSPMGIEEEGIVRRERERKRMVMKLRGERMDHTYIKHTHTRPKGSTHWVNFCFWFFFLLIFKLTYLQLNLFS